MACAGDNRLTPLQGHWADARWLAALSSSRSWADSLQATDAQRSVVLVKNHRVYPNLAWHERDEGTHCVRIDGDKLWLRTPAEDEAGPYVRLDHHTGDDAEGALYLARFFTGCYRSQQGERWCLSPTALTIGGKRVPVSLQMDLSEGPLYGTALRVPGRRLPFLVFVPSADGWVVHEDDYASADNRVPVEPGRTPPWRVLRRLPLGPSQ